VRILVTGSQLWTDKELVFQELDWFLDWFYRSKKSSAYSDDVFTLVHGHCPRGVDAFAEEWFASVKPFNPGAVYIEHYPANWKGPKKKGAGYARNAEMVALGADYCIAFILDESKGSTHCSELAKKAGIETIVFRRSTRMTEIQPYKRVNDEIKLENVRLIWRNFAGEEKPFNTKGKRNFAIPLDEPLALTLREIGWNVKDKEKDGEILYHLPVTVKMDGKRPPRIFLITLSKNSRTPIDEDTVMLLDWAEFEAVDVILRPFNWDVQGKQGVKAYLKSFYGILREDELEMKYADIPIEGEPLAIEADDDILDVEGEWVDDETDDTALDTIERKALERGKS
jgi:hypothetical protein